MNTEMMSNRQKRSKIAARILHFLRSSFAKCKNHSVILHFTVANLAPMCYTARNYT